MAIEGFDIELNAERLKRIDRLVDDYEGLIASRIDHEYIRETSWSEKLADKIALFGGSWRFITIFGTILILWIFWNMLALTKAFHFDPSPFILLNLCLSLLAAFQAPIIMMSQNRQAARDKRESLIDFAINYKSEQEIDDIQVQLRTIKAQLTLLLERFPEEGDTEYEASPEAEADSEQENSISEPESGNGISASEQEPEGSHPKQEG